MENFSTLNSIQTSKKKKMKNKRRFSDDQIRSLESIFENESKLEPRKKLQLARELGLHPRQVAIWFQNKRARFKSKQLEREYNVLLANYNALASGFESLKKEKQGLIVQLQKLNDLVNKVQAETQCCNTNAAANSSDSQSENDKSEENNHNYNKNNNTKKCECEARPLGTLEGTEYGVGILSDDGCSENTSYLGMNGETDLLTMVEPGGGSSLTSPGDWCNLRSDDLFNQSANSYEWWDFWS